MKLLSVLAARVLPILEQLFSYSNLAFSDTLRTSNSFGLLKCVKNIIQFFNRDLLVKHISNPECKFHCIFASSRPLRYTCYKGVIMMYFSIKKASNGQYYFVIRSSNNEIVATSETYLTKYSAEKTIESIKNDISPSSIVIDMT
ncbi:prophage P2a protein 14 [Lactiplantibacillus plantarum WCFS1]|uniref:Prophage P2a protein 14 n=3 Tax=Lactiplantibacillus plantarum TaxID=1590 RepID=F9UQY2_LACPL|nr:prophage P2a protein 14 [Lactiplantibacillus plantarum WCFS1]